MTVEIEAKRLEYQMNVYMKEKQKAKYQPSYFTKHSTSNTYEDIEHHVLQEKENHKKKIKSWNTMMKCDQWSLIKCFLETNKIKQSSQILKHYRNALVSGKIHVELDRETGKITNIDINCL